MNTVEMRTITVTYLQHNYQDYIYYDIFQRRRLLHKNIAHQFYSFQRSIDQIHHIDKMNCIVEVAIYNWWADFQENHSGNYTEQHDL